VCVWSFVTGFTPLEKNCSFGDLSFKNHRTCS
jgi:hypothetical protein